MRYVLLLRVDGADRTWWAPRTQAERRTHAAWRRELQRELESRGELVLAAALAGPEGTLVVRARSGSPPAVTTPALVGDRECLVALWVVDCESPSRALAIAAQISGAEGRHDSAGNAPIEVRPALRLRGEEM